MKTKLKQITAAMLLVAMLCGMLPTAALAADTAKITAAGHTYTRVTDAGTITGDGKYLLVLVKNENEAFFMKPEKREYDGRTGFALEPISCNGSDALTGAYTPYEWTFTKKDSGWLLGYSASYVKFEPENGDGAGAALKTEGSTLQIGEREGGHTLSGDGYCFNLDSYRRMLNGWKDGPSKFYLYERGAGITFTSTTHNAAPDVTGCTLEGDWSHDQNEDWTAGAYQKDLIYLRSSGAKAIFTFTGSGIRIYGKSGSDAGIAKITIDKTEVVNFDQYSAVDHYRSLMLDKTWSADGAHTVTVEYAGSKNDSSSGSLVAVDSFEILESTPAAPEEPYVPTDPEAPTQFMDCIRPAPVVGSLSSTCWGAADVGPRDQKNGLEDKGTGTDGRHYCYWDGGILKDEESGVYYMFASRWNEDQGHNGWPNSVGVYATSDDLYGPYVEQGKLWTDADGAGHNVFPFKLKAGGEEAGGITAKYAIVLGDTSTDWLKGAIFVSESLAGPWKNIGQMQFSDGGSFGLSNICIVLTPEGTYLAYNRNGDIAQADSIAGPWTVVRNNLWNQIPSLSGQSDVEDPVVWYSDGLYHCVVNRWDAKKAYYLTSEDGIYEWREHPGTAYEPSADLFQYGTGGVNHWTKIERPNVYVEDGAVKAMTFSVIDVEKDAELGRDSHGSKVVVTPFSNEGLKKLADCGNEIFDRAGISVSEDAHVQSWYDESSVKHGGWDYLCLKDNAGKGVFGQEANSDSGDDCKIGYLRFDLSGYQGQTVTNAELSLVFQKKFDGNGMDKIRAAVVSDTWNEAEVTWDNKPAIADDAQIVESAEFSLDEKNKVVTVDVTALVQKAIGSGRSEMTLALSETAGAQISIASKEYYRGYEPRLNVTTGTQRTPATYYVDSANGNDESDGLTQGTAWKTLSKVNDQTFIPGDKILLKRGCVWEGETLIARGSGSAERPIVINSYDEHGESTITAFSDETRQTAEPGEEQKPWIKANHLFEQAVLIENVEYWEVNNLQVSNDDPSDPGRTDVTEKRYGIVVSLDRFPGGAMDHIYVRNCYIHDSNGVLSKNEAEGIGLYVRQKSTDEIPCQLNDVLLEGNHLKDINRNGISFTASGSVRSTEVKIRKNLLENIGGDGIKPWGLYGCMVEYNKLDGGMERSRDKSAGIWPWDCDNATFQYNEVCNMKSTHDGQAFDIDYLTTNTIFQYNYTHDNEGGFMLLCSPDSSYSTGNVVRYNLSVNDGAPASVDDRDGRNGSVIQIAGNTDTYIYNNTFYLGPDQAGYPVIMVGDWGQSWNQYFYNNVFCIDSPDLTGFFDVGSLELWRRNYKFTTNIVTGRSAAVYEDDMGDPGLGFAPADSKDLFTDPESLEPAGFTPKPGSRLLGAGTEMAMVRDHMFDGSYHISNSGPDWMEDRYPFLNVNAGHDYFDQPLRAGAPDLGAIQGLNARTVTIATYVGEVPVLPGVTWESSVTAETFRTPYETVTVRGTDADGGTVIAKVEIVPLDTVYFLDLGKSGNSDAFDAVKQLAGDVLLNGAADQPSTGESVWGHTGADEYNLYTPGNSASHAGDKNTSGVYASNRAGDAITYVLPLEAGQYTVTSYHRDWWQNGDRPMDVEARIILSDGSALPTWQCRSGMQAGGGTAVTYAFAMPENGTLEYTVRGTAEQAAVISWLAVQKGGSAFAPRTTFSGVRDEVWLDTEGYPIQAHGGEVRKFGDTYYWIGEDRSVRGWPTDGVRVYSSKDLLNWTNEGMALRTISSKDQFANDAYFKGLYGDLTEAEQEAIFTDLGPEAIIERPKMLYNEKTEQYVMWFHADGPLSYSKAKAGVAVADNPAGPFKLLGSYSLNYAAGDDQGFDGGNLGAVRDMNLFQDDDGAAYIIYSSQGNRTLFISKLNEGYTALAADRDSAVEGEDFAKAFQGESREAPAMFQYDGTYYLVTSGCTGWAPNEARYAVAKSPLGPWSSWGNPCVGDGADTTFRTQSTCVFPVDAENGLFVYMGDRWSQNTSTLNTSGYVWLPVQLKPDGGVKIEPHSDWAPDDLGALAPAKLDPITVYLGEDLPEVIDVTISGQLYQDTPVTWEYPAIDRIGMHAVNGTLSELDGRWVRARVNVIPKNAVYFVDSGADGVTEYFTALAGGNEATLKNADITDQPYTGAATWGYEGNDHGTNSGGAEEPYKSIRYKWANTPLNYSFALEAGGYQVYVGHYDPWSQWAEGNRVANISVLSGESVLTLRNDVPITGDYDLTVLDEVTLAKAGTIQVQIAPKNTGENSDVMVSFIIITRTKDATHVHDLVGMPAKAPTCTEAGNTAYWHCADCGKYFSDAAGTLEIEFSSTVEAPLGHSYGAWSETTAATCTEKGVETRVCDNDPNHTETRETDMIPHDYSGSWSSDASGHWHACSVCATPGEVADHIPGAEATETEPQVCTVCGHILTPPTGHETHTPGSEWFYDETEHWHRCTGCDEKQEAAAHSGGTATCTARAVCSICEQPYGALTAHDYVWAHSEGQHWKVCTVCETEETGSRADHVWELNEETSTETEKHLECICGAEKMESVTPPPLDKSPLEAAIIAAKAAKEGVSVSDADPSDVPSGTRFVNSAVMEALDSAIEAAEDAINSVKTDADIQTAASALNGATAAFKAAIQEGAYVPAPSGGGSSSNTTTETEKNEDGSTTKIVTDKRTGAVTETTSWPDGTKLVAQTKPDGSVTTTEKRKDGTKVASATTAEGETTADVTVPKGKDHVTVSIPTPSMPGPGVVAVVEHADGTREVVKSSVATEDGLRVTLSEDASLKLVDNTKHFSDVPDRSWSVDAIGFVTSRELFQGTGGDTFSPSLDMTRGMFLTVLYRYDGGKDTDERTPWYAHAQTWAVESALSDGTRLEDAITREQLITLLYRYTGKPTPADAEPSALDAFADKGEISDYSIDAMEWAVDAGILNGKSGSLDPQGTATRAEVAAILQRFVSLSSR